MDAQMPSQHHTRRQWLDRGSASRSTMVLLPPLLELEQLLGYIPTSILKDTHGENWCHGPSAEPRENTTAAALPTAAPDLISIWQQAK